MELQTELGVPGVVRNDPPGYSGDADLYPKRRIPGDRDAAVARRRSAADLPPVRRSAAFQFNVNPDGSVPFVGTNYSSRNASWYDPNMRMPYVMSWSGGIQWGFRNNWVLETLYQGQSGVGLINTWDTNRIPLNISNDPAVLNTIFTASQNYKPYPQFGAVNLISNFGHNTYHGGTVRVEKRYSAGLVLNAFYTFQKTITDNENETGVGGVDYYNRRLEKGLGELQHRASFCQCDVVRTAFRHRAEPS